MREPLATNRQFELFDGRDETGAISQLLRDAPGPLLTFTQEVALSRRMRGADIRVPPPGDPEPTPEEARHRLITANVRLVVNVARRYAGHGVAIEDLVQEGLLSLHRATEKFDPDRGYRFSTYVTWWIRQAAGRALQNQAHTIRIPTHIGGRIRRVVEAESQLMNELEGSPTIEQIAERVGIDPDEVAAMGRAATTPVPIDGFVSRDDDSGGTLEEMYLEGDEDVEADAISDDSSSAVRYALSFLPPRERVILSLRFGIGQDRPFSLHEAGQVIGVTRERARQIEMDGMKYVRSDKILMELLAAITA